ncbi:hypothetical protein C8039_18410 [Halogeometricum sp. wsp3]|nr:hypothetical protein C8039_18410 [Halogeometricum sp. wsp3]
MAVDRLVKRANYGLLGPIRARIVRRLIRRYRAYIQLIRASDVIGVRVAIVLLWTFACHSIAPEWT